jgi:hypothetical protein
MGGFLSSPSAPFGGYKVTGFGGPVSTIEFTAPCLPTDLTKGRK